MPQKGFSKAWLLVVVAAVIAVGVLAWQRWQIPAEGPTGGGEPAAAGEQLPADETADWKTYRNEEYGFEVKCPEGWAWQREEEPNVVFFHTIEKYEGPESSCGIYRKHSWISAEETKFTNIQDWFDDTFKDRGTLMATESPMEIADFDGLKIQDPISFGCYDTYIVFISNSHLYHISPYYPEILDNFKFLK